MRLIIAWAILLISGSVISAESIVLSSEGSGRATGYAEANKIVSLNGKTHAAWLDAPEEGFRVRVATLDHASGVWSKPVTVGDGYDNHGGPALTVDSKGFLHIVYYPHHHAMRYRKSKQPNDASAWEEEEEFGEQLTYPTLVCGADDTLIFTARHRYKDKPYEVDRWVREPGGEWQSRGPILKSCHKGYSHFQESLAWGPNHKTLHLACRFHEKSDRDAYGRIQTVAYMMSPDAGVTWETSDGRPIKTPASVDDIEVLDRGGVDAERLLRAGAIAVDQNGVPRVIYSVADGDAPGRTIVTKPKGDGSWEKLELAEQLPERWNGWTFEMAGGLALNKKGNLVGVATVQKPAEGEKTWGHASNEVIRFESRDGGRSFSFETLSNVSPEVSHWLPSIERATGWNVVPERPGVIFTAGGAGDKNTDLLLGNRVLFAK